MTRLTLACALAGLALLSSPARGDDPVHLPKEQWPKVTPPKKIAHDQNPITVKVVVLEFDPIIPGEVHSPGDSAAKPKRLTEACGWFKSADLAKGYMQDVCDSTGGFVQYEIADWIDVRAFHKKADGFLYTAQSYFDCRNNKAKWHEADTADYPWTFKEYGVLDMIDKGAADEVWFFGGPYFGYNESAMAGPRAFYINGEVYDKVKSKRPFAIMGFNYERGVAEMLHDLFHRTESTMGRVSGGWKAEKLDTNWARWAANLTQSKGQGAGVGSCHWPCNAEKDYDYDNKREVESTADDYLNWPNLTGKKTKINREAWGGPKDEHGNVDFHRGYMRWAFARMPNARGVNADGRLNNWWEYVFRFDDYDAKGKKRIPMMPIR